MNTKKKKDNTVKKLILSIPAELHKRLKLKAVSNDQSLHTTIINILILSERS